MLGLPLAPSHSSPPLLDQDEGWPGPVSATPPPILPVCRQFLLSLCTPLHSLLLRDLPPPATDLFRHHAQLLSPSLYQSPSHGHHISELGPRRKSVNCCIHVCWWFFTPTWMFVDDCCCVHVCDLLRNENGAIFFIFTTTQKKWRVILSGCTIFNTQLANI